MKPKIVRVKKAENGYVLTIFFAGSSSERTVVAASLAEVSIILINEFEPENREDFNKPEIK